MRSGVITTRAAITMVAGPIRDRTAMSRMVTASPTTITPTTRAAADRDHATMHG